MKQAIILFIFLFSIAWTGNAQTIRTVGAGANYTTLKLAFDDINAGSIRGIIVLQIKDNTTETLSAVLNRSGSGSASYTSLTIYPTVTGKKISGNITAPLIDLNGADFVTIDGRLNATGSTKDLVITNTSNSISAATSTIRFQRSAQNNTIKYCTIKGSEINTSSGILFFSTATTGSGNINNIIDNNDITSDATGRPINAIYSLGTSGSENSAITVSNNNIFDIWRTFVSSNGIQLSSNTTTWTISGNSFYETTAFIPTGAWTYCAINIVNTTSGNGFTITGNYIGGKAASCGGAVMEINASVAHLFQGIYMSVGTTTASSIQNNTIQNIAYNSSSTNPWQGININAGLVNIGTTTGNTIGASTGTGSVSITGNSSLTNAYGIYISSTGTIVCRNNIVGAITTSNLAANSCSFYGIYKTGTGTTTISSNTIGSTSTAASITASSASTTDAQSVYGVYSAGSGSVTISSNTIANITNGTSNTTAGTAGVVNGITVTSGTSTISANTIRGLTIANANTSATNTASVCGLALTGSTLKTVSGNTIYNLSNTYGSFAGNVVGLYFTGNTGANVVSGNFIHSLTVASTTAAVYGIKVAAGATTYSNNLIYLGGNTATNLYGIYETGAAGNNNNLYFNTIYIDGVPASGTHNSYALYSAVTTNTRNFRNNVFVNARSTNGSHYAMYIVSAGGTITADYNDYFVSGVGGYTGYYGTNKSTSIIVTGQDVNSLAISPVFAGTTWTTLTNYYSTAALPGITGTGITTDFNSLTRGGTPKMGAFENNNFIWLGGTSTDFGTAANWSGNAVPPDGADISFAVDPTRSCYLDINRTLRNITNAQSTDILVLNGFQLTLTGNLIFSGGAQINATTASSTMVYAGTLAQSILPSNFLSTTIDGLTINNTNGVSFSGTSGSLTVAQTLTLTDGDFSIGALNTLTLNGALTAAAGTLTGGATSNLVFGGSGANTNVPAITLNNLTLNRTDGISLTGSVNVGGTLTLSVGTLTLGANTLTISGSSPTLGSGNIDASNASATMVFSNASAITIPESIFNTAVNNLTISGAGGVTSAGSFTVNGVLNLAAANPTATKGLLEMTISYTNYPGTTNAQYLNSNILTMGSTATTTGIGDVTGTVKRTTILANTPYTFGNQYTTIALTAGTMPADISVSITIGSSPAGKDTAIRRTYEIVPTGGSGSTMSANFHYLDSELQSSIKPAYNNTESKLVTWDYDIGGGYPTADEHGRSVADFDNNFIGMSNIPWSYFIGHAYRTLFVLGDYAVGYYRWDGSTSSAWGESTNWTPTGVPGSASHVIIPDAATTPNDPILGAGVVINTLTIENGGILTMGSQTLTIQNSLSGGWEDQNPLGNDPGTSTVIFSKRGTIISGNAWFYNVQIADTADITNQTGNSMKITNSVTKTGTGAGKWYADLFDATIEYNGSGQTVIVTDGTSNYHNLILSGSGTKTMPASALSIHGDFTLSGTVSATAAQNMTILGNLNTGTGTTFNFGSSSGHSIAGDLICDGAIGSASSTVTLNGTVNQSVSGSQPATFTNLIIDNPAGVTMLKDGLTTIGNLTINNTAGNHLEVEPNETITVSGTLTNNAGASGLLIDSDITGSASLISSTAGVAATVQQYHTDSPTIIYHMASPPVVSSTAVAYKFDGVDTYMYSYNPDAATVSKWVNITTSSTPLTPGMGYLVNYHNETTDRTSTFTGILNADVAALSLSTNTLKYNLVGNPYPCAIDWDAPSGWTRTNLSSTYYLWLPAQGSYGTYTHVTGTLALTNIISSGQGFFVCSSTGGTTPALTMGKDVKTHNTSILKSVTEKPPLIKLHISNDANGFSDETVVYFSSQATTGDDADLDASKLFTMSTESSQLYTANDKKYLVINAMPLTYKDSIPVYFKCNKDANYTIELAENTWSDSIVLTDLLTNETALLSAGKYSFSALKTDTTQRFILNRKKSAATATGINVGGKENEGVQIYSADRKVYLVNKSGKELKGELVISGISGSQLYSEKNVHLDSEISRDVSSTGVFIVTFRDKDHIYKGKIVIY